MNKSAVLFAPKDMRIILNELPNLDPDDVLIQVMACGVCGSDIHMYDGDQGSTVPKLPLTQGHEFSGLVIQTGTAVTNCKDGDRVCVDPADNCGGCYYCSLGMMSHCENMEAIGTTVAGGFAQYCVVKSRLIHHLADDVSYVEGAMAEALACCINGIERSNIHTGDQVLIYGGGMIGLLQLQLAKQKGAGQVALVEPMLERRNMALKLGADVVIDPHHQDIKQMLREHGMTHIRTIIECCGLKDTLEQAIDIVDRQGTIVLFAVTSLDACIQLNTYQVFQKEITITGSFCSPYTMGRAVALINSHAIDVTSMLGRQISLEQLSDVLADTENRTKGKVVVLPNGNDV